jgi:hypothetical protein
MCGPALIAETQGYPVLMWCRAVTIGAHQACSPLLQALFMTARAPTMSTVRVRMINLEVFIANLPLRATEAYQPPKFRDPKMN